MDDYIKRTDALNASKIVYIEYISVDDEGFEDGDADDIPCVFKEDIEKIPAADVRENVHGAWIKYPSGELICSNCGHRRCKGHLNSNLRFWFVRPKFCEACGAVMDGGKEK